MQQVVVIGSIAQFLTNQKNLKTRELANSKFRKDGSYNGSPIYSTGMPTIRQYFSGHLTDEQLSNTNHIFTKWPDINKILEPVIRGGDVAKVTDDLFHKYKLSTDDLKMEILIPFRAHLTPELEWDVNLIKTEQGVVVLEAPPKAGTVGNITANPFLSLKDLEGNVYEFNAGGASTHLINAVTSEKHLLTFVYYKGKLYPKVLASLKLQKAFEESLHL